MRAVTGNKEFNMMALGSVTVLLEYINLAILFPLPVCSCKSDFYCFHWTVTICIMQNVVSTSLDTPISKF